MLSLGALKWKDVKASVNQSPQLSRTFYFLDKILGPGAGFTDKEFFRTINSG